MGSQLFSRERIFDEDVDLSDAVGRPTAVVFMRPAGPLTLPSPPSDGGEGRVRGWSQKQLHRLMMTSTAYRQSSRRDALSPGWKPFSVMIRTNDVLLIYGSRVS